MKRYSVERAFSGWTEKDVIDKMNKCIKWGNVTSNGVVFDDWLVSSQGAGFALFGMGKTDEELEFAIREIRRNRDVVQLYVIDWIKE